MMPTYTIQWAFSVHYKCVCQKLSSYMSSKLLTHCQWQLSYNFTQCNGTGQWSVEHSPFVYKL